MALTATERLIVFEILGFPPGATVIEMWGELGRSQAVQNYSFRSPVEAIDGRITALTAEGETRCRELFEQWSEVSTDESSLNKAEEIEGVVSDAGMRRGLIRQRLQVYIPVYLEHELQARFGALARGRSANWIMRG